MSIYPNLYQALNTRPVVELSGYAGFYHLPGKLYACLDYDGPTGTARDGLAEGMLALAAEKQRLSPGQGLIEASSGSFAFALTLAGQTAGHPVWLAMPEDAPAQNQERLLRLGAQILHSPARLGLAGARALAEKIVELTGSRSPIVHTEARIDDVRRRVPDISAARRDLEWMPHTPLAEGLRKTISYVETALDERFAPGKRYIMQHLFVSYSNVM